MHAFLSGRLCLDLTTTLVARHDDQPVETLNSADDIRSWISAAGLAEWVGVGPTGPDRVRRLREAVDRICRAALTATPPDPGDVELLNDAATVPPLVPQLVGGGIRHSGNLEQAMSTIARDAIELLAGPQISRVRECAHPDCSRLFLDSSHAGRRRWCGMAACGNKAKAAEYRRRRRGAAH